MNVLPESALCSTAVVKADEEDRNDLHLYDDDSIKGRKAADEVVVAKQEAKWQIKTATTLAGRGKKRAKSDEENEDAGGQEVKKVRKEKAAPHKLDGGDLASEISLPLKEFGKDEGGQGDGLDPGDGPDLAGDHGQNGEGHGPGGKKESVIGAAAPNGQDDEGDSETSDDDVDDENKENVPPTPFSSLRSGGDSNNTVWPIEASEGTIGPFPSVSDFSPSLSDISGLSGHDLHSSELSEGSQPAAAAANASAQVETRWGEASSEVDTIFYTDSSDQDLTPAAAEGGSQSDYQHHLTSGHNQSRRARRHLVFLPPSNGQRQESPGGQTHGLPSIWDAED